MNISVPVAAIRWGNAKSRWQTKGWLPCGLRGNGVAVNLAIVATEARDDEGGLGDFAMGGVEGELGSELRGRLRGFVGVVVGEGNPAGVGGEWVLRIRNASRERALLVAEARQTVTRLKNIDVESVLVAEKSDPGRHVQAFGKDRDREPVRKIDILAVSRIKKSSFRWANRVRNDCGEGQSRKGEERSD